MQLILFQILAVLRDKPAEASTVLARLEDLLPARRVPSLPTFYRHLRRGMEHGWIEVEGLEDDEPGPGRPARIYSVTREGREAVQRRARELDAFTSLALKHGGEDGV